MYTFPAEFLEEWMDGFQKKLPEKFSEELLKQLPDALVETPYGTFGEILLGNNEGISHKNFWRNCEEH